MRTAIAIAINALVCPIASAQDIAPEPTVVRHERAQELIVRAWVSVGTRRLDGGNFSGESAGGLELGGEVGRRFWGRLGMVAVLGANAMAPQDYVSFGVNTVGVGLHWDGPIIVTAGAGFAFASGEHFTPDVMVISDSFTGTTAFLHSTLPLHELGSGQLGANLDLAEIILSTGPSILSASVGIGVAW